MTFGNNIMFIYTNGNFVLQIEKMVKTVHFLKYALHYIF